MTTRQHNLASAPGPGAHWRAASRRSRAFTLVELLVVMGVILLLAVLTTMASGRIGRDVRLRTAVNTLTAVLGEARAAAIRNQNLVLVTVRVAPVSDDPAAGQVSELVVAEWTRVTEKNGDFLIDRFRPLPNVPPRALPKGIKVAGPWTDFGADTLWLTQPQFAGSATASEADRVFKVMFGPDGSLITRNPNGAMAGDHVAYVDYNGNNAQDIGNPGAPNPTWIYDEFGDEPWLNPVQFLAVYDDDDARKRYDTTAWGSNDTLRRQALSEYIAQFADRINFNLYTGNVVRVKEER